MTGRGGGSSAATTALSGASEAIIFSISIPVSPLLAANCKLQTANCQLPTGLGGWTAASEAVREVGAVNPHRLALDQIEIQCGHEPEFVAQVNVPADAEPEDEVGLVFFGLSVAARFQVGLTCVTTVVVLDPGTIHSSSAASLPSPSLLSSSSALSSPHWS